MEWAKFLSTEKLSSEPPEPDSFKEYPINAFEKDYSRIVSSAAFRRLQDKTQVFPLDKSDFIRTRLTHSIEVSTIARQLGIMISKNTTQYKPTDIAVPEDAEAIASVLLCAGLLHDLGNPPFGHFGETVIGDWFKENLDHVKYKGQPLRSWLSAQMIADLENFEGNAQALRILLKAKHGSSLNLSKAIISTLVKYPTDSCSVDKGSADIRKHKLGFFAAEQETFEQISEAVGTTTPDKGIVRHPLTYLLEAADDIAYSTADLEDAFKKGLFTLDQFIEYYTNSYDHSKIVPHRSPEYFSDERIQELSALRGADHTPENDSAAFKKWLTQTRQWLMYVAIYRFSCKYKEIMAGTYCGDLFEGTNHAITIDILKGAMRKFACDFRGYPLCKVFVSTNRASIRPCTLAVTHQLIKFLVVRGIRAVCTNRDIGAARIVVVDVNSGVDVTHSIVIASRAYGLACHLNIRVCCADGNVLICGGFPVQGCIVVRDTGAGRNQYRRLAGFADVKAHGAGRRRRLGTLLQVKQLGQAIQILALCAAG